MKNNLGTFFERLSNKKRIILISGIVLILLGPLLILPNAFAAPVAVKSITITRSKLDYNKKVPGSYNIEKKCLVDRKRQS